ncbi:9709_t:CDS:2, partial [Gigaspora margarita]
TANDYEYDTIPDYETTEENSDPDTAKEIKIQLPNGSSDSHAKVNGNSNSHAKNRMRQKTLTLGGQRSLWHKKLVQKMAHSKALDNIFVTCTMLSH